MSAITSNVGAPTNGGNLLPTRIFSLEFVSQQIKCEGHSD
jgi:hypothetical protein